MFLGECLLRGVHSTTVFVFERPRMLDQCSIFGKWFVMPCLTESPPRISFLKVKVEIISPYFTPHSCVYMLLYCKWQSAFDPSNTCHSSFLRPLSAPYHSPRAHGPWLRCTLRSPFGGNIIDTTKRCLALPFRGRQMLQYWGKELRKTLGNKTWPVRTRMKHDVTNPQFSTSLFLNLSLLKAEM